MAHNSATQIIMEWLNREWVINRHVPDLVTGELSVEEVTEAIASKIKEDAAYAISLDTGDEDGLAFYLANVALELSDFREVAEMFKPVVIAYMEMNRVTRNLLGPAAG